MGGLLRTSAPRCKDFETPDLKGRDGFPMYPFMARILAERCDKLAQWPSSAALFLPGGQAPAVGSLFRQPDQAQTLQFLADEERAHRDLLVREYKALVARQRSRTRDGRRRRTA